MFSGTRTGTRMVLGVHIGDCTRVTGVLSLFMVRDASDDAGRLTWVLGTVWLSPSRGGCIC